MTGQNQESIARAAAPVAMLTDQRPAADIRATLHTLLGKWQGWRTDPSYPGRGRNDFDWHNRLDKTLAAVRSELDSLPADTDPITLADLARPLLGEFWPHRPGPIAEVAGQVAMLRALAGDRSVTREAEQITSSAYESSTAYAAASNRPEVEVL